MYILNAYYLGKLEFTQTFDTLKEAKLKRTHMVKKGWSFKITYQQD